MFADNQGMASHSQLLHTVPVSLEGRSYPILIGSGLIDDAATFAKLPKASSALIVSNTTIAPASGACAALFAGASALPARWRGA
jgi:3-dehydroquinate synthase